MRHLKIMFVTTVLSRGGAEQALVNLLPALMRRGHQCELVALRPPLDLLPIFEDLGVKVHALGSRRWDVGKAVNGLARLCRTERPDVIHCQLAFASFCTAMSRRFASEPLRVVSFQDMGYDSYPADTIGRKIAKVFDVRLIRNGLDVHTAVSEGAAQSYRRHFGIKEISVIPNSIPVSDILPDQNATATDKTRAHWNLQPDEFVFILPARFVTEKGHRYLLEALEILQRRGIRPRLLLAGDGTLRGDIERDIRQRGLGAQVILCGTLAQSELAPLMAAVDALVLPSTHEGLPLAPAEAMALSKPVLSTTVGGLPELIEDGVSGLLVPPADSAALAAAMERLVNDADLRQRLGSAARRRVIENFSSDQVAARWEELYLAHLDRTARHSGNTL